MAYFLALKVPARWRVMLLVLVIVPFWTSQLLRIYAWICILGGRGHPVARWPGSGWAMCA